MKAVIPFCSKVLTIFRREFSSYFNGPIAYVVAIAFTFISSFIFVYFFLFRDGEASMFRFFFFLPPIIAIFAPLVAMRLWAEEKRQRTFELLMTMPISTAQAVLGKFMGGLAFMVICLAMTAPIPIGLAYLGEPDWALVGCSYFGAFLLAAFSLAVGCFASSVTRDQVVAGIVGIVICILFYIFSWDITMVTLDRLAESLAESLRIFKPLRGLGRFVQFCSPVTHYTKIVSGLLKFSHFVFFGTGIGFFLWLNFLKVEVDRS